MSHDRGNHEISVADTKATLDVERDVLLLDVRRKVEFDTARINGAMHVPLRDLPERIDEIREAAAGRRIITVCHHGRRSLQAAHYLIEQGLSDVRSMAGGIDAWSLEIDAAVPRYY